MKNELKISTLSIVCVLCAAIVAPANGATAVRSLGGAGTYSGTSSAATAKSGTATSAAANTVRAGAMRLGTSSDGSTRAAATRTAASRVAATPRLSIGKYLAASSAPDKTVINNSSTNGNLQTRIEVLENWMGYQENSDNNIPAQFEDLNASVDALEKDASDLKLNVDKLAADIEAVSGEHTSVEYANKVLTVVRDGETKTYDLAKDFAGKTEFDALQAALNDVTGDLGDFATKVALNDLKTALEQEIAGKQAAGEYAAAVDLEALKSDVEALQGSSATGADLTALVNRVKVIEDDYAKKTELTAAQTALQASIDELEGLIASEAVLRESADKELDDKVAAMDVAYKAADAEIKAGFAAADATTLQSAKDYADGLATNYDAAGSAAAALAESKQYTDAEIADLTGSLGGATADLSVLTGRVDTAEGKITAIESEQDVQDGKISALETALSADGETGKAIAAAAAAAAAAQSQADKGVADAATVAGALDEYKLLNDAAVTGAQDSADAAQAAADAAQAQADKGVADAAAAAAAAQAAADAAKSAQNLADTNAAELLTLHAVAKSGSYTDLEDVPTNLVTTEQLNSVKSTLDAAIATKQAAGDYAAAADLKDLQDVVTELSGSTASDATVKELQSKVEEIVADYATDTAMQQVIEAIGGIDVELATLGALAYKDKVEADFINMELPDGTMAMLKSEGDKATWVTVSVVEGQ